MYASIVKAGVAALILFASSVVMAQTTVVRDLEAIYIKDGVDFARFDAVLIDRLGIDDAFVLPPPWYEGEDRSPKHWQMTEEDVQWIRQSYRSAMTEQMTLNEGYPVVTAHGDNVLLVDIKIVYLMPYARKDEKVQTKGFGEVLVHAQMRDGANGELLAMFEGKQEVGSAYQQNTRLNNENSLHELFEYWGMRVRSILDNAEYPPE